MPWRRDRLPTLILLPGESPLHRIECLGLASSLSTLVPCDIQSLSVASARTWPCAHLATLNYISQNPPFPMLPVGSALEEVLSQLEDRRGRPFCNTYTLSNLLIHLSGLKQQRDLQLLFHLPCPILETSFRFSDSWVSCPWWRTLASAGYSLSRWEATRPNVGEPVLMPVGFQPTHDLPSWPPAWSSGLYSNRHGDNFPETAYWTTMSTLAKSLE